MYVADIERSKYHKNKTLSLLRCIRRYV